MNKSYLSLVIMELGVLIACACELALHPASAVARTFDVIGVAAASTFLLLSACLLLGTWLGRRLARR